MLLIHAEGVFIKLVKQQQLRCFWSLAWGERHHKVYVTFIYSPTSLNRDSETKHRQGNVSQRNKTICLVWLSVFSGTTGTGWTVYYIYNMAGGSKMFGQDLVIISLPAAPVTWLNWHHFNKWGGGTDFFQVKRTKSTHVINGREMWTGVWCLMECKVFIKQPLNQMCAIPWNY